MAITIVTIIMIQMALINWLMDMYRWREHEHERTVFGWLIGGR
jgi:hypothetical protein